MKPVRLGIIGCGVIGARHVESVPRSPEVELVAVADLIRERARAAAAKAGISSYYDNDEGLLNDERVEAVVLAMPAGVRSPVAFKALRRGKHVLLEKPVANNAA